MGTKDRIQYIYCLYTIGSLGNIIRINSYLFMQLAENRVASPKCYQQLEKGTRDALYWEKVAAAAFDNVFCDRIPDHLSPKNFIGIRPNGKCVLESRDPR